LVLAHRHSKEVLGCTIVDYARGKYVLEIHNLHKSFADRRVLWDINLRVRRGEIYGLIGANGAGKTTLINLICNLLTPDRGSILIDGQLARRCAKAMIGIVPQENLLYGGLTCGENLSFFACLYGLQGELCQKRVYQCLQAVSLVDRVNCLAMNLSGGQQRRLSMALALLHDPPLIILDEPTTGLDIEARFELWELIQLLREQGKTLLITTHLLEEAERLCDRVGILKQGQMIAQGTLSELAQLFHGCQVLSVQVHTKDVPAVLTIGESHGFQYRHYPSRLGLASQETCLLFALPQPHHLGEIVHLFQDIEIRAISLQPVRLEHIYLELCQNSPAPLLTPDRQPTATHPHDRPKHQ